MFMLKVSGYHYKILCRTAINSEIEPMDHLKLTGYAFL